jgi:nucleotide-binding universal stress UspA family protein
MKILMGVDESTYSGDVLKTIVMQIRVEETEIRVLHVLQPIALEAPPQMGPGYIPELQDEKPLARELVERIAKELRGAGFKVDTAITVGDVRETIIDSAAEWHADLIIVGSHGQRGLRRLLLGSVAEFVARHAPCSVEVVRTQPKSASSGL